MKQGGGLTLAWRILTSDRGRTALAVTGVFLAILLVFVQLGFFIAVPRGGMLLYDRTRFDLLIASNDYEYLVQPGAFPLSRLDQARGAPQVALAAPLYFGMAKWRSGADGKAPDVFVIGLDPKEPIFDSEDINRQLAVLDQANTILVDSMTRPMFGPLTTGRVVEINGEKMKIGGNYVLGTGFMGLGVILVSGQNFVRIFPYRQLEQVNLGLIQLKPGVDAKDGAAALHRLLGGEMQIFTRPELEAHETAYWTTRTSVGVLFGSGLIISFIVGVMVVYQILAAQVGRQLPQFATLKAVGYGDRFLSGTVIAMALLIVVAAFFPALAASLGVYAVVRDQTLLPVEMSGARIAIVLVATLAMAAASALLSISGLRRADPADLFG